MNWIVIVIVAFLVLILAQMSVKIVNQYEAGVVFRLGRLSGTRLPGLRFIIPFVERMRKVDTRVLTLDVPSQDIMTRDNVTAMVNAVVYFRVVHPEASVIEVYDHRLATYQICQTSLRSVLGRSELDELLSQRERLNEGLQRVIDELTDPWGVKVSAVEIKDVQLPSSVQRAMAAQAEAERERRAKIVHAEGELQASERLAEAGRVIAQEPTTLQLRYLQTLSQIAGDGSSHLVFPLPVQMLGPFTAAEEREQHPDS